MVINQKIEITDQCWNVFFPFSFVCLFYWRRGGLWWNWEYLQPKMASDILFRSQQGNEKFDPPWSRNCLFYWLYVKVSHAHWISQVRQRIFTKNGEKKRNPSTSFPIQLYLFSHLENAEENGGSVIYDVGHFVFYSAIFYFHWSILIYIFFMIFILFLWYKLRYYSPDCRIVGSQAGLWYFNPFPKWFTIKSLKLDCFSIS